MHDEPSDADSARTALEGVVADPNLSTSANIFDEIPLIDVPGDGVQLATPGEKASIDLATIDFAAPVAPEWSFGKLIGTTTSVKFVIDTASQFFGPFLPLVVAGLGITLVQGGRLMSLVFLVGLVSPLYAALADRIGYRRVLQLTLLLTAIGLFLVGASSGMALAVIGFVIYGMGRGPFIPILQAYVSSKLPYELRGRGMGILEYAWALAGIVGLYGLGILIEATNWRVPLFVMAAASLVGMAVFMRLPPANRAEQVVHRPRTQRWSLRGYFNFGATARSTWASLATGGLLFYSGVQVAIIYGAWLADEFALDARQLGTAALILGLFDLIASVGVSIYTDRLGKRRSVFFGVVFSILGFALLTTLATSAWWAVIAIGIPRLGFEFGMVAYFPLLSEQAPHIRGKVMTISSCICSIMGVMAGFLAPPVYEQWGIGGVAATSSVALVAALFFLLIAVRERGGVTT